jgi:1-acyl-sn-glycerol-3-phosphate acyltransferase
MIWIKKVFFQFWFWLFGWKIIGEKPNLKKYVVIVAPHTTNWDFLIGLAAKHIIDLHSDFLGKKSLFTIPVLGWFMRSIGGHPVDRVKNTNIVDQVVELFNKNDEFVLALAPEGTRSYVPNIKTGFYHIAHKAGVPIAMVGFDYKRKVVEFKGLLYPTGDLEKDMEEILSYYRTIPGKYPEKGVK